MTAPYAPTLISPVRSQAARNDPVQFTFRYNAPTAQLAGGYRLMRRALPSGTLEYYNNSDAWQSGSVYRTAIAGVKDGDSVTVDVFAGWTPGTIYEWSVNFQNNTAETGPTSDIATFHPVIALIPDASVETPALDSRPIVRWWLDAGSGQKQKSFRLMVFKDSIYSSSGFDADTPGWLASAEWYMTEPYVASDVFRYEIGVDLEPAETYVVLIEVTDEYGISRGWIEGTTFTTNFSPPPAPTVNFEFHEETGEMHLLLDAAFNLVHEPSSSFEVDGHTWINLNNSALAWDPVLKALKVTGVGMSNAEADDLYGTYTNQDTAQTTFEAQRVARVNNVTQSRIALAASNADLIAVVAGQSYSMVYSIFPEILGCDAYAVIRWLNSSFVQVSESVGAATTVPPNGWSEVPSGPFAAPVGAVWAELRIRTTNVVDQVYYVDNVAFARSDNVAWTPGGLSFDLSFIVQRRENGGPWQYVWNATRDDPYPVQDATLTISHVPDRAYPIGQPNVEYRVWAVTYATGRAIASAPAIVTAPDGIVEAWWLRCYDGTLPDIRLRAMDFDFSVGTSNATHYVQNRKHGRVQESGDAAPHEVGVSAHLFSQDEYETLRTLLDSKKVLYIQRNIGNDEFYIRVTGASRYRQRTAKGEGKLPRHYHTVSFQAEIVGPPDEIVA
jgi:hypothetical protein